MKLIALILAALLCGCSVTKEPGAYGAIAADTATTAAGLAAGATEMNPLGWAVLPLSIGLVEYAGTLPPEEGVPLVHAVSAAKWGAAASNLLVLAGAGPASFIVGLGLWWHLWTQGQPEREFWAICAMEKVVCKFEPYQAAP